MEHFYAMQNIWLKAVKYIMKREKTLALNIFAAEKWDCQIHG